MSRIEVLAEDLRNLTRWAVPAGYFSAYDRPISTRADSATPAVRWADVEKILQEHLADPEPEEQPRTQMDRARDFQQRAEKILEDLLPTKDWTPEARAALAAEAQANLRLARMLMEQEANPLHLVDLPGAPS